MKLEKCALIAEIVGSFAIVVTLIILILEIRGNTGEIRAATQANLAARTQVLPLSLMTNPQWADVFYRRNTGEELSPAEETQFFSYFVAVLKLAEEAFLVYRDGRLDEEIWQTRANFALNTFSREQDREVWETNRGSGNYVPEFVEWFDAALVERYGE